MRRVMHGDVVAAGCALLAVPEAGRARLLSRMLAEAEAADRHRRATGRAHPVWGTGSLMSAALARDRVAEPFLDDRAYAECLALVFEVLARRARG
ncbi:hypothetical protein [Maritimibacter fusiformis]|uniref:DUF7742 domain-containing protein n=1 Tax=Maritimibacter fusiformis TaxID=2603819 RepID=A0A5D0RQP0_9RHOB|nr:hypothetical protein [Maritimibacter fusiformis]TYB82874.1 hypothetical protein FVF75_01440 [Maritimibacter fusiformis]